jgi:hypothetical protein
VHLGALVVHFAALELAALVQALPAVGLRLVLLGLVAVAARHVLLLRQRELALGEILLVAFKTCDGDIGTASERGGKGGVR